MVHKRTREPWTGLGVFFRGPKRANRNRGRRAGSVVRGPTCTLSLVRVCLFVKQAAAPRCMESKTEVNRQCNRHTLTPPNSSSFPPVHTVFAPRSEPFITQLGCSWNSSAKKENCAVRQSSSGCPSPPPGPPTDVQIPTNKNLLQTQEPVSALRVAFDICSIGTILGSRASISLRQKVQGPSVKARSMERARPQISTREVKLSMEKKATLSLSTLLYIRLRVIFSWPGINRRRVDVRLVRCIDRHSRGAFAYWCRNLDSQLGGLRLTLRTDR